MKTNTYKPISRARIAQKSHTPNGLTLFELDDLCDDPARDVSGQEVLAILSPANGGGYALSARDGVMVYTIVGEDGLPLTFRSIESALDRLADVPFLAGVHIDVASWRVLH